ncbi:MAG: YraN family protein [Clostridia bacterium]|nr:YraN family protein [Clostridia bacterium]
MSKGLGQKGEDLAVKELVSRGYKILERNFRCKIGEIDIIAQEKDTLVFIEVRSKSGSEYGLPQETVMSKKKKTIRKVAEFYLMKNKLQDVY